jgi:hypothetical protein
LEGQIAEMDRQIARLGRWIGAHEEELDLSELRTALDLYSSLCSRVTRMRQALDKMRGGTEGELLSALNAVLDELGDEWDVEL